MSGDPHYPRQPVDALPSSAQFRTDGPVPVYKLFGRGGSSVPPLGLTQRRVLAYDGAPGVLGRVPLTQSNSTNSGQGVNMRVLGIARDGSSTRARVLWDSADESEYADGWYRDKHSDVRTHTWITQLPSEQMEDVTHLVVIFVTRGSGGETVIHPGVQIRNHYQRVVAAKLGPTTLTTFFPRFGQQTVDVGVGRQLYERSFDPESMDIRAGQHIQIAFKMFVVKAQVSLKNNSSARSPFLIGFAVRFRRRDGGSDAFGAVGASSEQIDTTINDLLLTKNEVFIAKAPYTQLQAFFYFADFGGDSVDRSLEHAGISFEILIEESVEGGEG